MCLCLCTGRGVSDLSLLAVLEPPLHLMQPPLPFAQGYFQLGDPQRLLRLHLTLFGQLDTTELLGGVHRRKVRYGADCPGFSTQRTSHCPVVFKQTLGSRQHGASGVVASARSPMRAASRLSAARSLLRGTAPRLPSASARRWSSTDWSALQLSPECCAATVSLGLQQPTAVQALAIPQMLQGHSVGFAGATGTGKTMAFLLPVVEQLRQHEKELPAARRSGDARALILAPTRALAVQIGLVAKLLSHHLRFRVRTLAGGDPLGEQRKKMYSGCDVLVATPERLLKV